LLDASGGGLHSPALDEQDQSDGHSPALPHSWGSDPQGGGGNSPEVAQLPPASGSPAELAQHTTKIGMIAQSQGPWQTLG
jgi:hypothetical protein